MISPLSSIRLTHIVLRRIAALVWFVVGMLLLKKGLSFLGTLLLDTTNAPLFAFYSNWFSNRETVVVILIATALALGMGKALFVLRKVALKACQRLEKHPDPAPISALFGLRFFMIFCGAMIMSYSVSHAGLPLDIRGVIDVAVGGGLLNSATVYLRFSS